MLKEGKNSALSVSDYKYVLKYVQLSFQMLKNHLFFIDMKSVCNDKKYSQWANLESFNLWHNTPVYTSSEACQKKQRGNTYLPI